MEWQLIEQRLLWRSAAMMTLVAVAGTIMGIITNSYAILLDGIFSFVAVLIKLLMLTTSKLISKENSRRFQFGYWQFEPLVLITEGSFTLLIAIYAFSSAVIALLHGGHEMDFGLGIAYALFFTVADTAYYFYIKRINKRLQSNLVHYDNISWSIDAILAAGMLLSFAVAYGLRFTEWGQYTNYVDPIILMILSIQILPSSYKILKPSVQQIVGIAPSGLHTEVQNVMDDIVVRYHFKDYVTSIQQLGSMEIIDIDILVPKSLVMSIRAMDDIRNEIDLALGGRRVDKWLTVSFTGSRRWMTPDYDALDEEDDEAI